MQFKDFDLDPRLQANLQTMGFEYPTPIQKEAINPALEGKDVLGSAETGTGKTAAFLLPILQNLLTSQRTRHPRALVLVPTRELALQVADQAKQLAASLNLRIATIYGGVGFKAQEQAFQRGVDIVIATPGRLLDHAGRKNFVASSIQMFVLDEADRMLDVGFLPDIRRVARMLPRKRQTMLFSATLQPILELAHEVTHQPVRVEVETTVTPDAITQAVYPVPEHLKFKLLKHLIEEERLDRVLLFARTKRRADRVLRNLQKAKIPAAVIHGNRSQNQRVAALEAFRRGRAQVLVATDIAARGIDVEGISHVVNYDVPMQPEDYIHRIGRTGRAQAVGEAYTFVTLEDTRLIHRIEHILQEKLERRKVEALDYTASASNTPTPEEVRRYVEAHKRKSSSPSNKKASNGGAKSSNGAAKSGRPRRRKPRRNNSDAKSAA